MSLPQTPALDAESDARLHFTETWEDPRIDARALQIEEGDRVVAITAGGCTPLSLMTAAPMRLTSVDYSAPQTHLMALKIAALRAFEPEDVAAFVRDGVRAAEILQTVGPQLPDDAARYWAARRSSLEAGIGRSGVATAIFYDVGRLLRRLFRRKVLESLFTCQDLSEQRVLYERYFRGRLLRAVTSLLGPYLSRPRRLRSLVRADYFPYATIENVPAHLWERIEHALVELPTSDNYFLSRILLDRELDGEDGRPPYFDRSRLAQLRDNLDRVELRTMPIESYLATLETSSVDKLQLSNVFEWMPPKVVTGAFRELVRVAKPGARVVFRNLFTERSVPEELTHVLRVDEASSAELWRADRSFIYSRCVVAEVVA